MCTRSPCALFYRREQNQRQNSDKSGRENAGVCPHWLFENWIIFLVMPRFKRGIQYAVSPAFVLGRFDTDDWIARSSRAMTERESRRAAFGRSPGMTNGL